MQQRDIFLPDKDIKCDQMNDKLYTYRLIMMEMLQPLIETINSILERREGEGGIS